jgi:Tol biopolymer transport system component
VSLDAPADGGARLVTVLEGLDLGTAVGDARYDLSATGTLVYVPASRTRRRLVTVGRDGRVTPVGSLPEDYYDEIRLSPNGRHAAVLSNGKLSVVDLERGTVTPLVPELDGGARGSPIWSLDGATITFASNHGGNWDIYSKAASGSGAIQPILELPLDQYPQSYAPDGTLLFATIGPETGSDLSLLDAKGQPRPWVATNAEEIDGRFSPDGRAIAYTSNASGRPEVYVQSRENGANRLQVSASGGEVPVWSRRGDRIYFRLGTSMMEATVGTGLPLTAGPPARIFNSGWTLHPYYDAAGSGDGFVMIAQAPEAIRSRIDVVLNWFSRLDEKMRR